MAERRYPFRETKARKAFSSSVPKDDRLSDLSDDLLHQIFMDFNLKEVIRTCVLSKRWRYFWTTLSSLTFRSHEYMRSASFKFDDIVTQVLRSGCENTKINKLKVVSYEPCRKANIQSWICIAVNRCIQTLELQFDDRDRRAMSLPPSLFTCQSLRTLALVLNTSLNNHRVRLPLPNSIDLPNLKQLGLSAVSTLSTQFLDKLFAGCPVLEYLVVHNCALVSKSRDLVITSNSLKELLIVTCGDEYGHRKCEITVHAPNLIWFKCRDWCSNIYHLDNVASLETTCLENIICGDVTVQDAKNMVKLLEEISNVKLLTLNHFVLQVISQHLDILHRVPMSFGNLIDLEVTIEIDEVYVQAVKCILKSSPKIDTLIINEIRPKPLATMFDGWEEGLSLRNLKYVELHSAKGCDNDLCLLKGFLKSAMALEEMTLFPSAFLAGDKRRLESFTKSLMNFPRVSTRAKISFRELEQ